MLKLFIWQGNFRGGAERITLSAAKHFSQHGLNVTLGVYKKNPAISIKQIIFPKFTLVPQSFRPLFASLIFHFRYAKNFSAVYAHTLGNWQTRYNHVFIHDAADLDIKLAQTRSLPQKIAYYIWHLLYIKLSLKPAAAIFAATPAFAAYLKRHHINQHIITSGSFYDDQVYQYVKRLTPSHPIKIIFVGDEQNRAKNFALAKKLFYKKERYIVTVAGGFKVTRDHNFIYLGWLNDQELAAALFSAHIFFMPSLSEGFSLALLEALATGLPCLINQPALPSQLKNIKNLIPYSLAEDVLPQINLITKNYALYNVPDPRLQQFTKKTILTKECKIIKSFSASRPDDRT